MVPSMFALQCIITPVTRLNINSALTVHLLHSLRSTRVKGVQTCLTFSLDMLGSTRPNSNVPIVTSLWPFLPQRGDLKIKSLIWHFQRYLKCFQFPLPSSWSTCQVYFHTYFVTSMLFISQVVSQYVGYFCLWVKNVCQGENKYVHFQSSKYVCHYNPTFLCFISQLKIESVHLSCKKKQRKIRTHFPLKLWYLKSPMLNWRHCPWKMLEIIWARDLPNCEERCMSVHCIPYNLVQRRIWTRSILKCFWRISTWFHKIR